MSSYRAKKFTPPVQNNGSTALALHGQLQMDWQRFLQTLLEHGEHAWALHEDFVMHLRSSRDRFFLLFASVLMLFILIYSMWRVYR